MKFTHTLTLTVLAWLSLSVAASADNGGRLAALERQVSNLQAQLHELTVANQRLTERIEQLMPAGLTAPKGCKGQLQSLQDKLSALRKLGFKDTHPDAINVLRQIEDLEQECPDN